MSGPDARRAAASAVLAVLGAAVVVAFALVPWWLPQLTNPFWVTIAAEILIWSLLAASVNLLFGYTGLLSFGQALFFGFGMYGVAIGVSTLGLGFWSAFAFGIVLSVAMATLAGALAVRLTWHYFAIITVVFSLIFYFLALTLKPITGGDDGLGFSPPPLFQWGEFELTLVDSTTQYYFIFIVVGLCFALMAVVLRSPLGRAFVAVRENDTRAELIGINVYLTRLASFVIAGAFAGVAGALFAYFGRYASASYMFYHVSGEAVVWAIVGGTGTLLGPIIGAGLLIVVREELSLYFDYYLIVVGAVIILTVIFAPSGLCGLVVALVERLCGTGAAEREAPDAAPEAGAREPAE